MRLDKYLKVSRIIKRRTVAKEACEGGRVAINDKIAKPSTDVKEGDIIEITFANRKLKARIIQNIWRKLIMEKRVDNKIEDNRGNITLENRKKMTLTGVEEVISFDDEKILLNTKLGALTIKGLNLKMNKLDVQNGDVMINGEIYYIVYSGKEIKKEKESIIGRLFK